MKSSHNRQEIDTESSQNRHGIKSKVTRNQVENDTDQVKINTESNRN